MMRLKFVIISAVLLLMLTVSVSAKDWQGLSKLELSGGFWNQLTDDRTDLSDEGSILTAKQNGFKGGVGYGYFLKENLAIDFSVGILAIEVEADAGMAGESTEMSYIFPILVGLKYYYMNGEEGKDFRPYVSLTPGLFVGQQARSETDDGTIIIASRAGMAFGTFVGTGVDLRIGELFMLGFGGGFYLMSDFNESMGGSKNYSGFEAQFGFSFLFGKKAE